MKIEKKAKGKGKAIIEIVMAAIMIASIFAAMVTPAAAFVRDARTVPDVGSTYTNNPTVVIGELIRLQSGATVLREILSVDPAGYTYGATINRDTATFTFDTTGKPASVYHSDAAAPGTFVTLVDLDFSTSLRVAGSEVSSCVANQVVDVFVPTNIFNPWPMTPAPPAGNADLRTDIRLKIYDKDSAVFTTAGIGVPAVAGARWSIATGAGGLPAGDYDIHVETYTTGAAEASIDAKTVVKPLIVQAAAIAVETDPTSQVVGKDIVIATMAGAGVQVVVQIAAGPATFDPNKGDWGRALPGSTAIGTPPAPDGTNRPTFVGTIPSDGTLQLVITSATAGGNTIRAGIDSSPANGIIDPGEISDTTSASFRKAVTMVAVSSKKITIGDKVTVSGHTDSGVDEIAIFVENVYQRRVAVEADDTYEWEWDTSFGLIEGPTYTGRPLKPGALTVKVFEIHLATDLLGADGLPNTGDEPQPGDGLHRDCGGDGPLFPGGPECSFFDPANPAIRRHADASTGLLAELPDIIFTDKVEYSPGEIMQTVIHLRNPTDNNVLFKWYLGIPEYDLWAEMTAIPITLPAGYDQTVTVPIPVGNWGRESFCGCHAVSLTDTTTKKVVSVDSAAWIYMPGAVSESKTAAEIAKEITKEIGRVELPS